MRACTKLSEECNVAMFEWITDQRSRFSAVEENSKNASARCTFDAREALGWLSDVSQLVICKRCNLFNIQNGVSWSFVSFFQLRCALFAPRRAVDGFSVRLEVKI